MTSPEGICGQYRTLPSARGGLGRPRIIAAVQGFLPEGSMRRHDWIFDMLTDLRDYATANGLPDLASSVETTLVVARREAARVDGQSDQRPAHAARLQ